MGVRPVGDPRAAEGGLREGQSMQLVTAAVERMRRAGGWERTGQQPGGGNRNEEGLGPREVQEAF